jgi:methyl-accepting chemotaxis protein
MFQDMKIASRMTLLGAVFLVMILGGGITGFFGVHFQNAKLGEVLSAQEAALDGLRRADQALSGFRQQTQELKNAILRGNDTAVLEQHKKAMEDHRVKVQMALAELKEHPAGADVTQIAALSEAHDKVSKRYDEAMKLYEPFNPLGSAVLIDGMVKGIDDPVARQMNDLRVALETKLLEQSKNDAESANSIYGVLSIMFVLCTVLGLALTGGIFVWIVRSLFAQLGGEPAEAVAVARRIADGDLIAHVQVKSGDKSSVLAAVADMQSQLRNLIERLHQSAGELSGQASALSASSSQIAASSGHQTEAASSMASSIEQMTASIGQVAEHSNEALQISRASGDLSNRGNEVVASAAAEMEQIAASAKSLTEIIETLGNQSSQISHIVHVIQEIANQTNLLALNAAIEAARAGEQGRGFSVVAEEVRKLAERTTDSTREIGNMISAIQTGTTQAVKHMESWSTRVTEGVTKARGAGDYMRDIKAGANQVLSVVNEISHALGEQSTTSSTIAQGVERIARMSQENATAVGSVATSARNLEELAHTLETIVGRFKLSHV